MTDTVQEENAAVQALYTAVEHTKQRIKSETEWADGMRASLANSENNATVLWEQVAVYQDAIRRLTE